MALLRNERWATQHRIDKFGGQCLRQLPPTVGRSRGLPDDLIDEGGDSVGAAVGWRPQMGCSLR